ncbi:MAG: helix-turn-helix domain-containing protein [Coriobacteriales bacterium]|jgi:hypothetical protein
MNSAFMGNASESLPSVFAEGELEGYPEMLNTDDLGRLLGVCRATATSLCEKELPAVKIGHRWYVSKSRFVEYCDTIYKRRSQFKGKQGRYGRR